MPTSTRTTKSTSTTTRRAVKRTSSPDAVELLKADHKKVKKLFKDFEKLAKQGDHAGKAKIAKQICTELTVHTKIEESIFYPAAREVLKNEDLIDEAEVEHATAKDLVAQIQKMRGTEDLYDAKLKVLSEYIDHHVKEEEEEMFPKVARAKLDLEAVGEQMAELKATLMLAKH